jgi:uncharacterized protein YbbC (DUF1343 family)
VTDRERFAPIATTLAILETIQRLAGGKLELHADYFDKVMGTSLVREAFERSVPAAEIAATWAPGIAAFAARRAEFLLYR